MPVNDDSMLMAFESVIETLRTRGGEKLSAVERGTLFEEFCKMILERSRFFHDMVKKVWLWKDFPGNGGHHDAGIDIVFLNSEGEYCPVQCKFYNKESRISKGDIDSFISEAATFEFYIDGQKHGFSRYDRYLMTTSEGDFTEHAQNVRKGYIFFGYKDIYECGIDWNLFSQHFNPDNLDQFDDSANVKNTDILKLQDYQEEAVSKVIEGFKNHDRGKLIMACGSGKTITSLRLVERMASPILNDGRSYNVLYLVPSISLLAQTLKEWRNQYSITDHPLRMQGICSDRTAGKDVKKRKNEVDELVVEMPIAPSTDAETIVEQYRKSSPAPSLRVFFSTYQSIDVVHQAQEQLGITFDIAICDEAHRTIGSALDGTKIEENPDFVKIHESNYIKADKRLYMTATEKVYSPSSKSKAKESGYIVFSMDNESVYGPCFYRFTFGQAIEKGVLTDYRLVVLNVTKSAEAAFNSEVFRGRKITSSDSDFANELGAALCLYKRGSPLGNEAFQNDPEPMHRAIAFYSTIARADQGQNDFNYIGKKFSAWDVDGKRLGQIEARLIKGSDKAADRNRNLNWLRRDFDSEDPDRCRIITNARCLSEGVDVPALDAVIFMDRKNSLVDIIQAVGRVMRKFGKGGKKKYGYIIVPVAIQGDDESTLDADLSNSEDYKKVWQVVQALRSHDERLNSEINGNGASNTLNPQGHIVIDWVPSPSPMKPSVGGSGGGEPDDTDNPDGPAYPPSTTRGAVSDEMVKKILAFFSAHLVKRCGDRLYWDDWSTNIGNVTNDIAEEIARQIHDDPEVGASFRKFKKGFSRLLNPTVSDQSCIDMLAEHVVTLPVLQSIFDSGELIDNNPVTKLMQSMISNITGLQNRLKELEDFYAGVKMCASGITNSEGRQTLIRVLFEKFFKHAHPDKAEKFGIVYTPIEVVDFIINSVTEVSDKVFGKNILEPGVRIMDPFVGTGTFIVRLLDKMKEMGATKEQIDQKYTDDIWCNEIMLLAYYICLINVEDTYSRIQDDFKPYNNAVLTDTFKMYGTRKNQPAQGTIDEDEYFRNVSDRAREENSKDFTIIIGNPPYSVGQDNANDDNAKDTYPDIDEKIRETYLRDVKKNTSPVFDSYVRSFRWASDRIEKNGIISFVSNGGYVDGLPFSGFRRQLLEDFNQVWVYNLRGNCRTSGETRRKEKGNIFGEGSRTTICIIILVKKEGASFDGFVHYRDIGDYLDREDKLKILAEHSSIYDSGIEWQEIRPDSNNDWINRREDEFYRFPLMGNKKDEGIAVFSGLYSRGIATGKDTWQYNYSIEELQKDNRLYLDTYNSEVGRWIEETKASPNNSTKFSSFVNHNPKLINWSNALYKKGERGVHICDNNDYRIAMFRPFVKKWTAFNPPLYYDFVKWGNLMPSSRCENLFIAVPGIGSKKTFSAYATAAITDLHLNDTAQVFPLYWYEKDDGSIRLDDERERVDGYAKEYAVSEEGLNEFRKKYPNSNITPERLFFYVYGVLHSREYIRRYATNLAKDMTRIPYLKGFDSYAAIGERLMGLHINYEKAKPYEGLQYDISAMSKDDFRVQKLKFADDKTTIIFNDKLTISGIPLRAYEYVVNGRSPLEWVQDQYQYSVDADSGIVDDPNAFDPEKGGRYVFDLILSLITVSLETLDLIDSLPPYEEI